MDSTAASHAALDERPDSLDRDPVLADDLVTEPTVDVKRADDGNERFRDEVAKLRAEVASLRRQLQREVDARRLAEQAGDAGIDALIRKHQDVMLLGRIAVAANEAVALSGAAHECLALVARHAGWPAATLWARAPGDAALRPTGAWFVDELTRWVPLVDTVGALPAPSPLSLAGQVASSGAPVWMAPDQLRDGWLHTGVRERYGVASAFAVPIWESGEVVGVVVMFHDQPQHADPALMEFVEQVTTQLGPVVRRSSAGRLAAASVAADECPERTSQLAEIAHEVRTPLNGVVGNLELLCDSRLEGRAGDYAAVALQSALDLHRRIERWLSSK